jgi:hypothetical protein
MRSEFIFKSREEGIKHFRNIAHDFAEQIAPVYRLVQWTWGGDYIPTVDKLEESLNELIDSFEDRDSEYISSGGLVLECEKHKETENEEEFYEMKMSMVIDHSALFENIFGEEEEEEC